MLTLQRLRMMWCSKVARWMDQPVGQNVKLVMEANTWTYRILFQMRNGRRRLTRGWYATWYIAYPSRTWRSPWYAGIACPLE